MGLRKRKIQKADLGMLLMTFCFLIILICPIISLFSKALLNADGSFAGLRITRSIFPLLPCLYPSEIPLQFQWPQRCWERFWDLYMLMGSPEPGSEGRFFSDMWL